MKLIILFLFVLGVYLVYPTYDLAQEDPFDQTVRLVDNGFLTLERCQQAGQAQRLKHAKCVKTRVWSSSFSGYRKYTEGKELE